MRPLRLLTLVLLTLACGDDATGPGTPSVAGSWSYSATNLTSEFLPGQTCNVLGMAMTITQDGASFSGFGRGGRLQCSTSAGQLPDSVAIRNGLVDGNAISFELFGGRAYNHFGAHNGSSIVGIAIYPLLQGISMNGRFVMTRK